MVMLVDRERLTEMVRYVAPFFVLVVIAALPNRQLGVVEAIDQTMFLGDAPGPRGPIKIFELLRFPHPRARGAKGIFDEEIDAFEHCPIRGNPVLVVVPAVIGETDMKHPRLLVVSFDQVRA